MHLLFFHFLFLWHLSRSWNSLPEFPSAYQEPRDRAGSALSQGMDLFWWSFCLAARFSVPPKRLRGPSVAWLDAHVVLLLLAGPSGRGSHGRSSREDASG